MKVKELINKLLDCKMDADILVEVKIKKDIIEYNLEEYGDFSCPIDDDAEIKGIVKYGNKAVGIELKELEKGATE